MTVAASSAEKHNGGTAPAERPLQNLSTELSEIEAEVRRFVRDRPLLALGAAVAAGYVVGRILSKL